MSRKFEMRRCQLPCWPRVSLIIALTLSLHSVEAQDRHPLQSELEGLWTYEGSGGPTETLLDREAEGILTEAAETYRSNWRIEEHDDEALCRARSPAALAGSAPDFEIFDGGVSVHLIAFEQVRRVYMDGRERPAGFWANKLGWSEGRWEGNTLVIRTTDLKEGSLPSPEPLLFGGPEAEMIERYTLSEGASRLSVDVILEDPTYYIHPMEFGFEFVRSDKTLHGIDCIPTLY